MKEMLSKAKRTDNGEWVEGYYFEYEGKTYIMCMAGTILHVVYTYEPSVADFEMRGGKT